MNREEKNRLTREQIVSAAVEEFGMHSYSEASLNEISKRGGLSKGIIYHYFKDKDELYLVCVRACFTSLLDFLGGIEFTLSRVEESMEKYLSSRQEFFKENPYYSTIFTNALLQPPKHLKDEIRDITAELESFNVAFYERILDHVELKEDVTRQEAVDYFMLFQESFNHHFQKQTYEDIGQLFQEHELKLKRFLKLVFHGIVKEELDK